MLRAGSTKVHVRSGDSLAPSRTHSSLRILAMSVGVRGLCLNKKFIAATVSSTNTRWERWINRGLERRAGCIPSTSYTCHACAHTYTVSYAAANPTALMTKRVGQGCVALLLVGIAVRLCASWYSGWGEMLVNRTELATPMDRLSLCMYTNTHSHGQCVNNGICCMIWTLMPRIYGAL